VSAACSACGADWGALVFTVGCCANCRAAQLAFDDLIERAAIAPQKVEPAALKAQGANWLAGPQYIVVSVFSGFAAGFLAAWLAWRH
jgi:hypothetical protein